jgi:hypothetical protein
MARELHMICRLWWPGERGIGGEGCELREKEEQEQAQLRGLVRPETRQITRKKVSKERDESKEKKRQGIKSNSNQNPSLLGRPLILACDEVQVSDEFR